MLLTHLLLTVTYMIAYRGQSSGSGLICRERRFPFYTFRHRVDVGCLDRLKHSLPEEAAFCSLKVLDIPDRREVLFVVDILLEALLIDQKESCKRPCCSRVHQLLKFNASLLLILRTWLRNSQLISKLHKRVQDRHRLTYDF